METDTKLGWKEVPLVAKGIIFYVLFKLIFSAIGVGSLLGFFVGCIIWGSVLYFAFLKRKKIGMWFFIVLTCITMYDLFTIPTSEWITDWFTWALIILNISSISWCIANKDLFK